MNKNVVVSAFPCPGPVLWASGREGLAEGLDPGRLAGMSPAWAQDVLSLGPWQEVIGEGAPVWWRPGAPPAGWRGSVAVCGPCPSVLDVAWFLAGAGALGPWDSVVAVSQWSGRGQLRRAWHSPPGNLYAALALPPVPKPLDPLLPILVGYCLVEVLERLGFQARLKWPNDVLADGAKVSGILVEERDGFILAGIGVNLTQAPPPEALRDGHAVPAGCLAGLGPVPTPLGLWRDLVDYFRFWYAEQLPSVTPELLAVMIEKRMAWLGAEVVVSQAGADPCRGRLVGLAPDGALLVAVKGGSGRPVALASGSVWPA